MDLAALSALEARELLATGQIKATELLDACIANVELVDPVVNAMVIRNFDQARSAAAEADEAEARGDTLKPLHGLPVAIKDLQSTAGIRTTLGTVGLRDHVPSEDSGIVARIRRAGGIIIGKTNIPERSIGANTVNRLFGATGNPFDPTRTCGGSSGGSGVALATNMAPLATGSDHGGSVRTPACYSGVVGHRATPGTVPFEDRTMTQNFYSVQGPMARTVGDTALLLSVIADRETGTRPHDPMMFPLDSTQFARLDPRDAGELRVAFSEDLGGVLVSDEVRRLFRDRVARIAPHVAVCEPHPIDLRRAPGVDWAIRSDIFVTQYHHEAQSWGDDFNPNIRQSYEAALEMPMERIAAARSVQTELNRQVQAIFADFDVLLCPGVSVPPFPWTDRNPTHVDGVPVENYMAWLALTSSFSVVGHPVTALPCGFDEHGTPFGIQVVGPMYRDRDLLNAAAGLEALFGADPVMARPVPDLAYLAALDAGCTEVRM